MLRGLDAAGLRTVIYVNIFPNVLDQPAPRLRDDPPAHAAAVDSTRSSAPGPSPPRLWRSRVSIPSYAMDLWDITNQQDWDGLRLGAAGPACPTPARARWPVEEDAVYQFVTMVARGYPGLPSATPAYRGGD